MPYEFGNNRYDGYQAKPYVYRPTWQTDVDQNPDHRPSSSMLRTVDRGADIVMMIQVKGLGALCLRATSSYLNKDGKLRFEGVSLFDRFDIGYSPDL